MKQRDTSIAILLLYAAMFAASTPASAQVTDFSISTSGPHHVVQGRYFMFYAVGKILAGTDEGSPVPTVTNLPPGATVEFPNMQRFCCQSSLYQLTSDNPVRIVTSPNTPVGTYTVQVKYTTKGGVTRSVPYTVYVDPVPVPPIPLAVTTTPPLAGYNLWKANAATYGLKHCTPAETSNLWEGNVWYYDGARVYFQISDLTGDHSFDNCAAMVQAAYSQYVNANSGRIPGYTVFPQGLAMRYQRFNDAGARQTLANLRSGGAYTDWANSAYVIDWSVSRETSYAIETNLADQSVGGVPNPHLQDLVEAQFGHFDQWFLSKSSSIVQPFMVALASEALIAYWDKTQDPRVLPMLKLAADQLWAQSWSVPCQCFLYYNDPAVPSNTSPAADLNGLIAPIYGWVFKQTGLTLYRDRGDQIFNGSQNAWLDGGKQFSQTYRWSGKYVEWRTPAAQASGQSTLSCDLNGDGNVNVVDVQLATNQTLGYAACGAADLNGDGACTVVDVQRIINTSLGAACHLGP
jgi:hypothetical protein